MIAENSKDIDKALDSHRQAQEKAEAARRHAAEVVAQARIAGDPVYQTLEKEVLALGERQRWQKQSAGRKRFSISRRMKAVEAIRKALGDTQALIGELDRQIDAVRNKQRELHGAVFAQVLKELR